MLARLGSYFRSRISLHSGDFVHVEYLYLGLYTVVASTNHVTCFFICFYISLVAHALIITMFHPQIPFDKHSLLSITSLPGNPHNNFRDYGINSQATQPCGQMWISSRYVGATTDGFINAKIGIHHLDSISGPVGRQPPWCSNIVMSTYWHESSISW